jgi:hypothetical protein
MCSSAEYFVVCVLQYVIHYLKYGHTKNGKNYTHFSPPLYSSPVFIYIEITMYIIFLTLNDDLN